ncbi:MAG: RNA methyltransferase [Desulfovibrio sp.]|nr:MAG: RNA methyltransferase [Desulfovibrio sp.]
MHIVLDNLSIVLVRPKYPENIGGAARACVNLGCPNLVVVDPLMWNERSAMALATPKGAEVLKRMRVEPDLDSALKGFTQVFATTARTGGWRKGVLPVKTAAKEIISALDLDMDSTQAEGGSELVESGQGGVGVVFGPEDRGLTNEEIEKCGRLVVIPTADDATSLNLAQAVLLVLYECFNASSKRPPSRGEPLPSRLTTQGERELMYDIMRTTLSEIDFLKQDNPAYWLMPVRRFVERVALRRNELNLVLGVLKQTQWMAGELERTKEKLRAAEQALQEREELGNEPDQ